MNKKKQIISVGLCATAVISGCSAIEKPHWSHEACVAEIVRQQGFEEYTYSVTQVAYDGETDGNDEIYCFNIIVTEKGGRSVVYRCFAVVDNDEVMFVDCDLFEEH